MTLRHLAIPLALVATAGTLRAQTIAQHLQNARGLIVDVRADSAITTLAFVLDPRMNPSARERAYANVLLGAALLMADRRPEALQAFRRTLRLNPTFAVDSLAELQGDLVSTFENERRGLARDTAMTVMVEVPADPTVPMRGGGLQVVVGALRPADVRLVVSDAVGRPVYRDSLALAGAGSFDWPLRTLDGDVVPAGRYRLRIVGRDSAGRTSANEWGLEIEAAPPDTQPLPAPPRPTELAAESLPARHRTLRPLLMGGAVAAGTALLASYGPGPSRSSDRRALVVGGVGLGAGLVTVLVGSPYFRPNPAGVEANRQLRDDYARRRAAVEAYNTRQRERAMIRVRAVRAGD